MLKIPFATIVLCFTFSFPLVALAQTTFQSPLEVKPVTGKDYVIQHPALGNIKLTVYQSRINFKNGISPRERRYYYAPFIALRKNNAGDLDVTV